MDAYEATRIVFSRIQTLDPENAAKIMGLLLIQDHSEKELIRLAFGPETLLHSVILKAKKDLGLLHPPPPPPPPRHTSAAPSCFGAVPPPPLSVASPSWAPPAEDLVSPSFIEDYNNQDIGWGAHHRRSCSADLCLSPDGSALGWKPCLYFARGFCKNGSSCRFLHDFQDDAAAIEHELLLRSPTQRLGIGLGLSLPYSPTGTTMNYLLQQQQQNESQRVAAAAAAVALMSPRSDFAGMSNPVSRQIYLTFPADSTFREEDVSNYFSIYGPVQDVRIPYQQKRMFGFVTFVYPETVKLILAKGNPHFVCDARVLVKPYKEKGKVPDKFRKQQQQGERGDFSGCTTTAGLDSRDPYDLLGARMLYNNGSSSQEMLLRRKLEEQQQQAAELQQAIEIQGRRFMGLQLLDFKNRSLSSSTTISSPTTITTASPFNEESPTEDKSPSPASSGGEQQVKAVNAAADEEESAARESSPNEDSDFQESVEHNLPDSPFASPTKAASLFVEDPFTGSVKSAVESELVAGSAHCNGNGNGLIASTLLPPTSTLDMASFKSCFFQMPRFSSDHGAVGL